MQIQLNFKKLFVRTTLVIATILLAACGGGGGSTNGRCMAGSSCSAGPITTLDGRWGYYLNGRVSDFNWCDVTNNYCGTGQSYGITDEGKLYNGQYAPQPQTAKYARVDLQIGYTNTTTGIENSTTDTGMMQAMLNSANVDVQANELLTQFPIRYEAARRLVQLRDEMQILQRNQEMTEPDQQAFANAALSVGHVSRKDVTKALAQYANGKKNALTNLELKYARGIGLPQSYLPMVRDQILPQLGVTLPNN